VLVADVPLLVVVEVIPLVEILLVVEVVPVFEVEITPLDDVLLVVEVTKVVVTLCVVTTAAGVHCAYPRSRHTTLNSSFLTRWCFALEGRYTYKSFACCKLRWLHKRLILSNLFHRLTNELDLNM
jgi:hypothetical protein